MQQWTYPWPVSYCSLGKNKKIQIAYSSIGNHDQTLLFIHGLGSNQKAWIKNIEELSQHFRCVILDLPGYGKSSQADYNFSLRFFVKHLTAFIQTLQLTNVSLVGHSMGGQIAIHLALKAKIPVQNLILLAPAGFEYYSPFEGNQLLKMVSPANLQKLSPQQIKWNFDVNFYDSLPQDANFMYEDRLLMVKDKKAYTYFCHLVNQCVAAMLNEPILPEIHRLTTPTLLVYGANDNLIPSKLFHNTLTTADVAQKAAQSISNAQLEMIDQAGHFLIWEQPQQINQHIIRFIKSQQQKNTTKTTELQEIST